MTLYIVGLGLGDEKDITVRGLEAIQKSEKVFLEAYTSILSISHQRLEAFYNKTILVADRNFVEGQAEQIYEPAKDGHVSFLVVGDPVCATTHTDLMIRARDYGVSVEIIHNASVMGAVGSCGLQLYNFGATISIPFFEDNWRPKSFYSKIEYNRNGGMHTLCLLDIKVKEPNFEAMKKGKMIFLPPRFMSVHTALEQLIEIESIEQNLAYDPKSTLCVGMARLGQLDQCIKAGTMEELLKEDFGEPLHCIVICGETHELEREYLKQFIVQDSQGL